MTLCEGAEIVRQSILKGGWVYTQGPHETSLAKAEKKRKATNCGRAILWALVMMGDLTEGPYFYGNKGRFVAGRGALTELQKAGWELIHINGKYTVNQAIKNGTLKRNDVVMYQTLAHTNLYAGNGFWYDFGHAYSHNSGIGSPLKEVYGKTVYGAYAISYILRKKSTELYRVRKSWKDEKSQIGAYESLANAKKNCKKGYSVYDSKGKEVYSNKERKEPAKSTETSSKIYRVRIGIYSNKEVMEKTAVIIKGAGFPTFTETVAEGTALYCGSYSTKKNAEARVKELKKVKVNGKALSPAIIEK